jgi:drug/metabolite transporter (DMT)-like permease
MPQGHPLNVTWIRARGIPRRSWVVQVPATSGNEKEIITMNILIAIVAIIAVILLFTGGFVQSLNFLLWVGIVLLIIAAVVWLIRMITGRRAV